MSAKKPHSDKVSNVAPFGLRMLPELKDRVQAAADANARSMNAEIISRLDQSFQPRISLPEEIRRRIESVAIASNRSFQEELMNTLEDAYPAGMTPWVFVEKFAVKALRAENEEERERIIDEINKSADSILSGLYIAKAEGKEGEEVEISVVQKDKNGKVLYSVTVKEAATVSKSNFGSNE